MVITGDILIRVVVVRYRPRVQLPVDSFLFQLIFIIRVVLRVELVPLVISVIVPLKRVGFLILIEKFADSLIML